MTGDYAKYADERIPRYTSYPTAPRFSPAVSGEDYRRWLAAVAPGMALSLYVHIPFCETMCWYCGCNTTVASRHAPIARYLDALHREIAVIGRLLAARPAVTHLHFGGGTPSILAATEFSDLIAALRRHFAFAPDAEIAIEIDPRRLRPDFAEALAATGVSRASLGVQSFDPRVQAAINRIQSVGQTAAATARLRAAGVSGVSFDLIYGLPHQSVASCLETVAACLPMRPERFSVFGYAHVPGFKKHQRRIPQEALPDGPARRAQAEAIAAALGAAGYRRIGLDHYALPDDAMAQAHGQGRLRRNFQGYTTDAAPMLIGLGASAIGRLPQGYVQNHPVLSAYAESVFAGLPATARGYVLSEDDRLRAHVIERLMCDFAVDLGAACAAHGRDLAELVAGNERLEALRRCGIVSLDPAGRLSLADSARDLVRVVAAAFDAYLGQSTRTHSVAL